MKRKDAKFDATVATVVIRESLLALGWLAYTVAYAIYSGHLVILNVTWVCLFFLVAVYFPYFLSWWLERLWGSQ